MVGDTDGGEDLEEARLGDVEGIEAGVVEADGGVAEAFEETTTAAVFGLGDDAEVDDVAVLDVAIDMVNSFVIGLGMQPGECHEFVDAIGDVTELDVGIDLSLAVAVSGAPTVVVLLPVIGLQWAKTKPGEGVDDALLTDVEGHVG